MNASATGEQPSACAPDTRTLRLLVEQADLVQLVEALADLREQRTARDRDDDVIGNRPAELLRGLEREGLRTLGVVRPHVDVDERPLVDAGELGAQTVDVVVVALDRNEVAAVDRGRDDLALLEIGRARTRSCASRRAPRARRPSSRGCRSTRRRTTLNPNSSALLSATETTRSLNEFVGLRVSFLSHTSPRPSSAASRSARTSGVKPGAEIDRGVGARPATGRSSARD